VVHLPRIALLKASSVPRFGPKIDIPQVILVFVLERKQRPGRELGSCGRQREQKKKQSVAYSQRYWLHFLELELS
jgi:hypothetical protein